MELENKNNNDIKKNIYIKFTKLNSFIRELEDFSNLYNIDLAQNNVYIIACAQRKLLKDLIEIK